MSEVSEAALPESESLRTRIAYALAQALGDPPGMEPASSDFELADAVIRELRLKREDATEPWWDQLHHRYVSEWSVDE